MHALPLFSSDTICALSTPDAVGALSVVRLSGKEAFAISEKLFVPAGKNKSLSNRTLPAVVFGNVMDGQTVLDEALLTLFKGPKSFTGEDTVEFSLHGSAFIRNRLLQMLLGLGARLATPGEFTKRAFMNGKMDLSQAEAIGDLIHSESEAAHKIAMHQMRGGFGQELAVLRQGLISFASLIELELDFGEEDVEFANRSELREQIHTIRRAIGKLLESFRLGNAIKNGVPVAIVGAPNAGKSTLLNALLNEEKAIVSAIAGTTRDVIEDTLQIGGIVFRMIDTAGIRDNPDNEIEQIGIERSLQKAKQADIILYLCDMSQPGKAVEEELARARQLGNENPSARLLFVANKADLGTQAYEFPTELEHLFISAKENSGIEALTQKMLDLMGGSLSQNQTIVANLRHYDALLKADQYLQKVLDGMDAGITGDFLAMDIRQSLYHLGEITGNISTDDLLDNIFTKFCIGK